MYEILLCIDSSTQIDFAIVKYNSLCQACLAPGKQNEKKRADVRLFSENINIRWI